MEPIRTVCKRHYPAEVHHDSGVACPFCDFQRQSINRLETFVDKVWGAARANVMRDKVPLVAVLRGMLTEPDVDPALLRWAWKLGIGAGSREVRRRVRQVVIDMSKQAKLQRSFLGLDGERARGWS